ncbi:hypothetical protein SNL152K_10122 [Streptomyces sp. NL15-2K]|nr:hypothetical protein SNL152K_10122 [Streptomyces sp. NL15-2K]
MQEERLLLVILCWKKEAAQERDQGGGKQPVRRRGTTTEDLARSASRVPCPTCKAPVGKPCTVPGSRPARFRRIQKQQRP